MAGRVVIVVGLLLALVLVRTVLKQALDRRRRNTAPRRPDATVPARFTEGADRTWVVFTTPMCTTCDPVVDLLRASQPASRVVKIDATVERSLADALGVRSAPTAVLARADGVIEAQLVGPEAVSDYLGQME